MLEGWRLFWGSLFSGDVDLSVGFACGMLSVYFMFIPFTIVIEKAVKRVLRWH